MVKSIKIGRVSLLFLIDLLVIDLVIISTLTICNNITICPIKIEMNRLYISLNHHPVALPCLYHAVMVVLVSSAILTQSRSKIACGQGVFNPR